MTFFSVYRHQSSYDSNLLPLPPVPNIKEARLWCSERWFSGAIDSPLSPGFAGFPNKVAFLPQLLASQLTGLSFGEQTNLDTVTSWGAGQVGGQGDLALCRCLGAPPEPKCVPLTELSLSGLLPQYPFVSKEMLWFSQQPFSIFLFCSKQKAEFQWRTDGHGGLGQGWTVRACPKGLKAWVTINERARL